MGDSHWYSLKSDCGISMFIMATRDGSMWQTVIFSGVNCRVASSTRTARRLMRSWNCLAFSITILKFKLVTSVDDLDVVA